ncbi:glycosyltransferase 87 family protein [Streptomyces gamaensis]|uniref:Glycosyltransferase 87 family protein n=1 Tax=Streptomyces gamaensis TaxID=1763542 RepID=A0ABW0YVS9_9ACTN
MNTAAVRAWLLRGAPLLLAVSLAVQLPLLLGPSFDSSGLVDLRVYRSGAPHVLHGGLYDFRLHGADGADLFPLPFTYPPFAALLFLPLAAVPLPVAAAVWLLASALALGVFVHCCLRLTGPAAPSLRHTLAWTTAALWTEPVLDTHSYGQVNVLLAACVTAGVLQRGTLGGLGTGLAAAVKLTPATACCYFLLNRRWRATAGACAAFAAATAGAWLIAPDASARFWFHVRSVTTGVQPTGTELNQSLRGALSRTLGHDVGLSAPWWLLAVPVAALALAAAVRCLRRTDPLGCLVAVEFLGLLLSPVAWGHHWVWAVPAVLVLYRDLRLSPLHRAALALWAVLLLSQAVRLIAAAEESMWGFARPWYLTAFGWAYPTAALLTLAAQALTPRTARTTRPSEVPVRP